MYNNSTKAYCSAALVIILSGMLLTPALLQPAHAATTSTLTVNAYSLSGDTLHMYTIISSDGTTVKAGFTPLTYIGTDDTRYTVQVYNYKDLTFSHWGGGNGSSNPRTLTMWGDTTATAYYNTGSTQLSNNANSCEPLGVAEVLAGANDGNVPANTLDNDLSTRWSNYGVGSWIRYDLGQNTNICNIDIAWYKGNERQADFVVSTSVDGTTYKDVYSGRSSGTTLNEEVYDFADITARYVRITVNGNTDNLWASITEANISGASAGTTQVTSDPPVTLSFSGLSEGQTLNSAVVFTVKASDPSKVDNIKAYVDGSTLLKTERYDPYDFPLNPSSFSSGTHKIDAIATLKNGGTVSRSVSVNFGASITSPTPVNPSSSAIDKFGVKMVYPTKSNGEQWFMDMANPSSDPRFDPKASISKNSDGSWKMEDDQVRMNVFTSSGYHPEKITTYNQQQLATKGYMQDARDWRNVEMTGYVKVNSGNDDNFAWYARGGKHNDDNGGCEGTAYKGNLFYNGDVRFSKEQQHSDGYSFSDKSQATGSLNGKWIGFKTIMYNNAQGNVVLQIWLDEKLDGVSWKKVYDMTDSGGWGSDGDMCGGSPDQKITWGGPTANFRWDSASDVDFKWLSVREIQPPA